MEDIKAQTLRLEPLEEDIVTPDLPTLEEGKAYRRISDGVIYSGAIFLGKLFFLNGEKLEVPIDEKPEHFEIINLN